MVAALCNLAVSDENKYEIVKSGCVPALISLSQSGDMLVASQACSTMANLAELKVRVWFDTYETARILYLSVNISIYLYMYISISIYLFI